MPDLDKVIKAEAFKLSDKINTECKILVSTNAYKMRIDNSDLSLVIQWDLPMRFDSIIQQMRPAKKQNDQQAIFIFMTLK